MLLKLLADAFNQPLSFSSTCNRRSNGRRRTRNVDWQATSEAHLAILKMGVPIWNHWRVRNPLVRPLLVNVNLTGMDLENVNLCQANLRGADLSRCYLYDADFQEADLRAVDLSRAGLIGANLHKADLSGANLSGTYLSQSDLSHANFSRANLQKADLHLALLTKATLKQATLAKTVMTDCLDLTWAQLQAAQDAHLAFCSRPVETQLSAVGISPDIESEAPPIHRVTERAGRFRDTMGDRQHHHIPSLNQQIEHPARPLCPAI